VTGNKSFVFKFADVEVREREFCLVKAGEVLPVEPKTFRVLLFLLRNPQKLIAKEELLNAVWGDAAVTESSLTRTIAQLRRLLGDEVRNPRYIETVATVGYRFLCPVDVSDSLNGQPEPGVSLVTSDAAPRLQFFRSRGRWLLSAMIAAALFVAVGLLIQRRWRTAEPIRSLAVIPLVNLSGDASEEYFADGMTDELITELARIPGLRVVSRTSVMQEKGVLKPLRQIASELNVEAIVEGSVARSGNRVRITAQLIDVRNDKHLWAQSFEGQLSDVLSLQNSVAREIAFQTQVALAPAARTNVGDNRRIDPAAHDAYLRGLYFLQKREADISVAYFQKATAMEPGYAPAFAGLANALHSEWVIGLVPPGQAMPAALAAAKSAIQLDPNNGEAYAVLASIETDYEWNWDAAERDLERGVALSPSSSYAYLHYAIFLDAMNRPEEAVTAMRRALELDPLSFFMNRHLGTTLYFARRYDEALYHLRQAREMEPGKANFVDGWVSAIYEKEGKRDEAVNADLSGLRIQRPKINIDRLHSVYQRDGWKAYWLARTEAMQPDANEHCMAYYLGTGYLRAGNRDSAFRLFNQAVDERCYWMVMLKVDPMLDDIRTDGRYSDLLRRVYSHE
jgi:TolB-like protein/DNA-binding winged helix-turn-helix (wHTH) protein